MDKEEKWSVLRKASTDSFDYACKLITGEVIYFMELEIIDSMWIHLKGINMNRSSFVDEFKDSDRGMDVNINHIVYLIDAPNGS